MALLQSKRVRKKRPGSRGTRLERTRHNSRNQRPGTVRSALGSFLPGPVDEDSELDRTACLKYRSDHSRPMAPTTRSEEQRGQSWWTEKWEKDLFTYFHRQQRYPAQEALNIMITRTPGSCNFLWAISGSLLQAEEET